MRLNQQALAALPAAVAQPGYDRRAQAVGIVHFGIGAFHRGHQAWYTDAAMNAGARDWAITGVSLRSADVAMQMNPQDGLYTLAERGGDGTALRVVGAVRDVLVAPQQREAVCAALAAPGTRIAMLTITEKGYCRAPSGDLDPALAHEGSVFAFLAEGLSRRAAAGLPGLTLLSCDNLAHNGQVLERLLRQYLALHAPALLDWFTAHCTCPDTMVDRIVPATTDADRARLADALGGLDDAACVMTEPFSQWVIEDRFAGPRPPWEQVGAQLVADVAPYETAKLRMLNGAHSLLAYVGLARGHVHVHEAVADPELAALVSRLLRDEAAPTIAAAPGQDLPGYADALLARFANPMLHHRLAQIAMDGSQKLPQRWLHTLAAHAAQHDPATGAPACPAILAGMAAWLRHLGGANGPVDDPLAGPLAALVAGRSPAEATLAIVTGDGPLAGIWTPSAADLAAIEAAQTAPDAA